MIHFSHSQDESCREPTLNSLAGQLSRLEELVQRLVERDLTPPQEFYSTADVARILGKAEWTVREWCRNHRVTSVKRKSGRGRHKEWMISHEELERIRSEGLLPPARH